MLILQVPESCLIMLGNPAVESCNHSPLCMDVCRICGNLALRNVKASPTSDASRRISNQVGSLILLKETLELLPGLGQPLEGAHSELLHAIGNNCCHDVFQSLHESVIEVLDEVRTVAIVATRLSNSMHNAKLKCPSSAGFSTIMQYIASKILAYPIEGN